MSKFEELLAQYNVTAEDITFDYEGLSDEELEAKFSEVFGEDGEGSEPSEGEGEPEVEPTGEPEGEPEGEDGDGSEPDDNDGEGNAQYSLTMPNGTTKNFSLSLSEISNALFTLVNDTYSELDNDIYSVEVYEDDSRIVMLGWFNGGMYRQNYKRKKDNFSLDGDRVKVRACYLTEDEEKQLENMKANYSVMESKFNAYESEPDKIELINSEDYAQIRNTEEFAEISKRENYFEMSKEDLAKKLDDMLLAFAKNNKIEFSAKTDNEPKKVGIVKFANVKNTSVGRGRYGGIFSKKD